MYVVCVKKICLCTYDDDSQAKNGKIVAREARPFTGGHHRANILIAK